MNFTDVMLVAGGIKRTSDGAAVIARVARGGNVQDYLGSEMGFVDRKIVRVYRPEDQVFSQDAINSYARKPITINHPKGGVTPESWKDLAVGEIDPVGIMRDGDFVTVPLMFRDAVAISLVEAADGPKELSMGYSADIEFVDGVSPSGEPYDAVMSNFDMNHVAVVPEARGGKELRIGDGAHARWGASPHNDRKDPIMADAINTRTVLIDGLSVVTTDAGAQALEKLQKQIADAETAQAATLAASTAAIAAKDEEIGTLKADAKKLTDAALTPEKMTQMVADRVALETLVKSIAPTVDSANVGDADLRKAAVASTYGDEMVKDASDAEITGMFKALAKDVKPVDAFADSVKGGLKVVTNDAWGAFLPAKGA